MLVQEKVSVAQTQIITVKTVPLSHLGKKPEGAMLKDKTLQPTFSDKTKINL